MATLDSNMFHGVSLEMLKRSISRDISISKKNPKTGLKEISNESFNGLGKRPVIKDILSGSVKLEKGDIEDRISEHLSMMD